MNREYKSISSYFEKEHEEVKNSLKMSEVTCKCLEEELNDLTLFKTEAESKIEQLEKKLKGTERELAVAMNNYRIYEDKNIELKKEFDAQQR
jgi:chromosome segregation ATPase